MATEKLGTLEYDMKVNDELLDKTIKDINKKLKEQDKKWKDALSNIGSGYASETNKVITSNERIKRSTEDIASSIKALEKDLKNNISLRKSMSQADRDSDKPLLEKINQQKLALNSERKLYDEEIRLANQAANIKKKLATDTAKWEESLRKAKVAALAEEPNTIQSIKADKKVIQTELKNPNISDAQIKAQTIALQQNDAALKKLNKTKEEQVAQTKNNIALQQVQSRINATEVGSIQRLKAELEMLILKRKQLNKDSSNYGANLALADKAINTHREAIAQLSPTQGIWQKLKSAIMTYATAYVSVQAAIGSARAIYNQTKELDQLQFSMKTVIKSASELAQTQRFLGEVAVNYGGDLLTLSERYIKFRAAALQSNMTANDTQKIFNSVSKAAGTLGLKTDELSGVYLALEQMISKGKVTTEELRRQLGERLPGAFGIMANALGVTIPQLDKMLKKGQVLSQDALPKFAVALEKAYGLESVKKIDTLAAAQGRLSTQTTLLIKGLGASDTFKTIINSLASFVGVIANNIETIVKFGKAIAVVTTFIITQRAIMAASILIQKLSVIITGQQIAKMQQLTLAQLASAEATWVNVRSWSALSTTFKTFGGWISILVNVLITAAGAFVLFGNKSSKVAEALKTVDEEARAAADNVKFLYENFKKSNVETDKHKNALSELNTVAIKYNSSLFTENDLLDKNNTKRTELLAKMDEEIRKKRYNATVSGAEAELEKVSTPIKDAFLAAFEGVEGGYSKATDAFASFMDKIKSGTKFTFDEVSQLNKLLGAVTSANARFNLDEAFKKYTATIKEAESFYKSNKETKKLTPFDEAELDKAKKEFEDFAKLQDDTARAYAVKNSDFLTQSLEGSLREDQITYEKWLELGTKTYKKYLEERIKIYQAEGNQAAVNALQIKLTEQEVKDEKVTPRERLQENRNKALEDLNNRYKQDQIDLVNFDAGISAARIAIQEDSLQKEININELAYQNTLEAIRKETEAREKLLLTISKDPTYSRKELDTLTQEGISLDDAKIANAKKVKQQADVESTRKYAYQIAEIERDINDQFLTGIEKEKAAIKEKYDDWAYKAKSNGKVVADIEAARRKANAELDKQYAIDQLDFQREIQYKRNEIKYSGAGQQDLLDQANFQAYIESEMQRVKLLTGMSSIDKQKEGMNLQQKIILEKELNILTEEEKKRIRILDVAKQLSTTLVGILNITQSESTALSGMVNIVSGLISNGLFSKGGLDVKGGKGIALALEGATQILSTILNQSAENKKAQEVWNASIEEGVHQLSLLNIEALAYKEANIFGIEDPYSKAIAGAKQYGAAMGELSKMVTKLENGLVQIDTTKVFSGANIAAGAGGGAAIGAVIGSVVPVVGTILGAAVGAVLGGVVTAFAAKKVVPVFDSLKKQYGEIYSKDTFEINPRILADYDKLDTATKKLVDNWKDIATKAKEAQDQMTSTFSDLAGSLGDSLSESLINAFTNGTLYSAVDDFRRKVGDTIASITQQLLMTTFFQKYFDAAQEGFNQSFGMITDAETGKLRIQTDAELARLDATGKRIADATIVDDLDTLANGIVDGVAGYGKAAAEMDRLLKEKGYAGLAGSAATEGTVAGAIKGVTEDTARRLEGLINSIRETQVGGLGYTKKLVESNQMIQGYASQSLTMLTSIDLTTKDQLKEFRSVMTNVSALGGSALKVVMS